VGVSCQKGVKDIPEDNNTNAVHADNHANVTSAGMHFGVLINAAYPKQNPREYDTLSLLTFEKKLMLASFYGVKYIRMAITHDAWVYKNGSKGFIDNFEAANNAGFSVLLNVNYHTPAITGTTTFADAKDYALFLKQVLDALQARNPMLKPALVAVENEETNTTYFQINSQADADKYINLLKSAIAVCAPRNIKVTNGGITSYILTMLTWDWLKTKYGVAMADNWASNVMAPNFYNTLSSPAMSPYLQLGKYMISNYANLSLSYVNIHWYEPLKASQFAEENLGNPYLSIYNIDSTKTTAGALDSCVSYLNATLGLNVITNETGQLSRSNLLTASIMRKYFSYQSSSSNFPIVSWYDGDADGATNAKALHNGISSDSFSIRITGKSFHNHLQQ
jgi:hypothetical protein